MEIELRKIHHSVQLSEETEAFTANIYINGIHAGHAQNRGSGGPTDYYHENEKGRELIVQAEKWCKSLPPRIYPGGDGMEAFSIDRNLENYIDDLLNDHLQKKEAARFNKRMEKDMEKSVIFGIAGESYTKISYKIPIAKVLEHPRGAESIAKLIKEKVAPKLEGDIKLLNTNILESILKQAGLTVNQYTKPFDQLTDVAVDNRAQVRGR